MRINHNIAALNTYRQLGSANEAQGKSMEKLSSGLRINNAADDAAGLAISEKMRGQIRGLDMASKNAQDATSLIQTAEGALNETHDILQRMRELAVQSSNDTNTGSDRLEIQKEVDQLSEEVSRISKTTQFNTQKVLDGSFSGSFQIGANSNQNLALSIDNMGGNALGITGAATVKITDDGAVTGGTDAATDIKDGEYTVHKAADDDIQLIDVTGTVVAKSTDGLTFENVVDNTNTIVFTEKVESGTVDVSGTEATGENTITTSHSLEAGEYTYDGTSALKDAAGNIVATSTDGITFTKGADTVLDLAGLADTVALTAGDSVTIKGVDMSNKGAANDAVTTIQKALDKVSAQRSSLGAVQNRLEHTVNNLNTSSENLTAAESRIRDVDMAKEMMAQTKNSILSQAAQAMLAQSNQMPQGVLQLLR